MTWSMVRASMKPAPEPLVGVGRRVDQVANDRIALEQVGAVDEVLPHQVLGEGQRRERDLLGDLPALDALDVPADGLPDSGDVDAGGVLRQFAVEFRHRQVEVLLQHLQQRRIEARLVLVQRETEAGAHAFALELYGNQDQRRSVRPGAVLRRPFQEAEAQIEDVGAALLEGEPGSPVEIGESAFEFGVGDVGVQVAPLHRVQDEILARRPRSDGRRAASCRVRRCRRARWPCRAA